MPPNRTHLTATLRTLCAAAIDPGLPDRELVTRFVRQQDQAAFSALVRRHGGIVWSVCRRVLGQRAELDDAVQATFVILARRAGSLKHPELVGAWLYAVARKVALKARNGRSAGRVVPLRQDREPAHTSDPLDTLSGREVLAILDEELTRLPEEYRAVLLLCCIEGKSREEAAQRLGWSEGSVKGRLERGRDVLSRRLKRRGLTLGSTLGVMLVWHAATAKAAIPTIAVVPGSASPSAVALADAVAAALGTPVWVKAGIVAALVLTGTGVGLGVWGHSRDEPRPARVVQTARSDRPSTAEQQPDNPAGTPPDIHTPAVPPEPRVGATVTALLRGVDPESRGVTLRVRETDTTYPVAGGAVVRIDDAAATLSELAALGGKVRVQATLNVAGTEVVSLVAEGEIVTGTVLGKDLERLTVTVRRRVTDPKAAPLTWSLATNTPLTLDGRPATLAELREGYTVRVRLSADGRRVASLEANRPATGLP